MTSYVFALALCLVIVALVVQLLRSRRIREKYASVWIVLALAIVLLGLFPQVLYWLTRITGVETPINLLFAVGFVVVLGVCIQLSASVSSLEERARTLTEEVALLRLREDQRDGEGTRSLDD